MLKQTLIAILILLTATEAFATDTPLPIAPVETQVVRYDAATDRLSLDVHALPLTQVLARISRQSGVEILAAPGIDSPVTASVQNQPLEGALGDLTRGMNVVMIHDQRDVPGQGKQPVLVRMELLPVGQSNKALLHPLRVPGDGATPYAGEADPAGARAGRFFNARRQARHRQTDPDRRQERAAAKADNAQATESERQARNRQRRLERLNRQLAEAQALAATDPEASQQHIQKINQKIARIQQRQEKATGASPP